LYPISKIPNKLIWIEYYLINQFVSKKILFNVRKMHLKMV
jgi:hypothetical protein